MNNNILFRNATIVNEGQSVISDMLVTDGTITRIGNNLEVDKEETNIIDCEGMLLTRKGQRLSVQPVDEIHFDAVLAMAGLSRADL